MTQFPELFAAMGASFESHEVRVRSQAGRQLSYITARTAMNRLDTVLGPENWWDEYIPGENSVVCKLTVRLPDGSTLTKSDAGGYAGMADSGDDDKSGFSDAFKRAAVKFGVGRYLYRDGVPSFVRDFDAAMTSPASVVDSSTHSSSSALPTTTETSIGEAARPSDATSNSPQARAATSTSSSPRSGRALFAWTKDQEQRHQVGLLKYLNGWAKLQDYPGRMVDWDHDQVVHGYDEACRKLQAISTSNAEVYEEAMAN